VHFSSEPAGNRSSGALSMMMQSENKMFAILIPRSGFLNFFQSIFNLNQTRINMLLQYGMLKKKL